MRRVWVLWTRQACGGAGTRGATRVEVCPSDRWARLGAPHHGFKLACYSYDADDAGNLTDECHEWDTDEAGWPPAAGSWALKLGPYQVSMLDGVLRFGGWWAGCAWKLHRNRRHDERLAERLAERGLLRVREAQARDGLVRVYEAANPDLCRKIVENGGIIPREALGEVTR